jgi:hypothetical protein
VSEIPLLLEAVHPDPNINVPLLRKSLEHITAHPEQWEQHSWAVQTESCGTQFCLAGWAVSLAGHDIEWGEPDEFGERFADGVIGEYDSLGNPESVENVARRELGFTANNRGGYMFFGSNTLGNLWHLANTLTCGEIDVPEEFLR